VNYVKYCFLKEFYQLLGDAVHRQLFVVTEDEDNENKLVTILSEVILDFIKYCKEEKLADNPREAFRAFCKIHLFQ
jgi:hypothetical protein